MSNMKLAIERIYKNIGGNVSSYDNDEECGYITLNISRSGREVLWYFDDRHECAIYIDNLSMLTSEEIESELE